MWSKGEMQSQLLWNRSVNKPELGTDPKIKTEGTKDGDGNKKEIS